MASPLEINQKLQRLIGERDGMGAVNLQAEEALEEKNQELNKLEAEEADVRNAVALLHTAIDELNQEGKARLKAAFKQINTHFTQLFTRLFGGGEASLRLVEHDEDPLALGLEIMAMPPGKKMQILSLLSGGEQALTALSLLFAMFLTNPAPICVLDEVDAPLDDANVDRFITLLEEMTQKTQTRFLIVTHHRMTMARANRLYGVTMAEEGVSQLVSVNLDKAMEFAQ